MKKAVCLFSGGLDSSTVLYLARTENERVIALSVRYGQLHAKEIDCARLMAKDLGLEHHTISISLPWGASALLDPDIAMPFGRGESEMQREIPPTYVPARNSIFLSLAASCAEATGCDSIYVGANALDYSGYPDCRPDYFDSFNQFIRLGTKAGREGKAIRVKAPLLKMSKGEIVALGARLKVPFEKTWSCYQGKEIPCGQCDSCLLRAKGFREAGIKDPLTQDAASALS